MDPYNQIEQALNVWLEESLSFANSKSEEDESRLLYEDMLEAAQRGLKSTENNNGFLIVKVFGGVVDSISSTKYLETAESEKREFYRDNGFNLTDKEFETADLDCDNDCLIFGPSDIFSLD